MTVIVYLLVIHYWIMKVRGGEKIIPIQEEKVISSPTSQTRKADKDQDENREEEVKATTGTRRCKSTDVGPNQHAPARRQANDGCKSN